MKGRMNAIGAKLKALYNGGVRKITVFYTRQVNGKTVVNHKRIALTAAVIAAAAGGAYYLYRRHKKHGHALWKKKERAPAPAVEPAY